MDKTQMGLVNLLESPDARNTTFHGNKVGSCQPPPIVSWLCLEAAGNNGKLDYTETSQEGHISPRNTPALIL